MLDRRRFLASSVATSLAATAVHSELRAAEDKQIVTVGIMGMSRGKQIAQDLAVMDGVRIKYVCDVDTKRAESAADFVEQRGGYRPQAVADFRRILDDGETDALLCAAPNHWHAPATILGCKAGKHVYVEKPCSHNPQEGEWMVEAAKKYGRVVQMGTQRRSSPETRAAIEKVRSGAIGNVYLARSYYNNLRGSIGSGKSAEVPEHLDYALWQGPAPKRPYQDNVVHYNWHWFWHWGNGELGNNGVHSLDLCRWGMDVDYPTRVASSGGRYAYDDDQQTPDTHTVGFEFAEGKMITWHGLSCNKHSGGPFVTFYGDRGTLELDSGGQSRLYDRNNKLVEETKTNNGGQREHLENFLAAVRAEDPAQLNQPILEGHRSTLLCHLGNIAHRTGRTVNCDSETGKITGDEAQMAFWRREYDPAWEKDVATI